MKHTFIIIFCIYLVEFCECAKSRKTCDIKKLEDKIHNIFSSMADRKHKWPESEKEMTQWCRAVKKDTRYIKRHADNCMTGWSRAVLSIISFNTAKANKFFCKTKSERDKFIDKGACGNAGKQGSIKCWNDMYSIVANIAKLKNPKDKIPSLCCSFYWFKECVLDVYSELHPRYCTQKNLDHAKLHTEKVATDTFKAICQEYEDRDKCFNYWDKLDKTQVKMIHRTPFPIIFEILESI